MSTMSAFRHSDKMGIMERYCDNVDKIHVGEYNYYIFLYRCTVD